MEAVKQKLEFLILAKAINQHIYQYKQMPFKGFAKFKLRTWPWWRVLNIHIAFRRICYDYLRFNPNFQTFCWL